jgi:hypothetical protein
MTARLLVMLPDSTPATEDEVFASMISGRVLEAGDGRGNDLIFSSAQGAKSWQEVEQALRDVGVVGSDNTVHVRAVVQALE